LRRVLSEESWRLLDESFLREKKEVREEISRIYRSIGARSVLHLLQIMEESKDRWVRKSACDTLSSLGASAIPLLLKRLKEDAPWFVHRNIIMILGDIGKTEVAEEIKGFLHHRHPRVREEVLHSLYKLLGAEAEQYLVKGMDDPELSVKKKAISLLGTLKTSSPQIASKLIRLVERKGKDVPEEDESLQIHACATLAMMGNISVEEEKKVEDFLLESLSGEPKKLLRFGGEKLREKSDSVKGALIDALARVGTSRSLKVLERFKGSKNPDLRDRASRAIEAIRERESR